MYRKEHFMGFASVNYSTGNVSCDNLTGTDACVVKTVKPKRDIVCDKRFDIVNQNNSDRLNPRNIRKDLVDTGMNMDQDTLDEMKLNIKNKVVNQYGQLDNGLSFDELDQLSMEQMDMNNMNIQKLDNQMDLMSDDVSYSLNHEKDLQNKKIRDRMRNSDTNTLSDVDDELLSLN
jgi:hypothetical protein